MNKIIYWSLGVIVLIGCFVFIANIILCANGIFTISSIFDINTENGRFIWDSIFKAIGAVLVIWGLVINAKRLEEVAKTNTQSEKGHNVTRFNSALEHLSDKNIVTAIGGVFELEELSLIEKKYRIISLKLLHSKLRVICDEIKEVSKEIEFAIEEKPKLRKTIEKEGYNKINALYELRNKILSSLIEHGEKNFSNKVHKFENVDFSFYKFKSNNHTLSFKNCVFKFNNFTDKFAELEFEDCKFEKYIRFEDTHKMNFKDCNFEFIDIYYVNFNNVVFKGENIFNGIKLICCKNVSKIDFSNIECYEESFVKEKLDSIERYGEETLEPTYKLFEYIKREKSDIEKT